MEISLVILLKIRKRHQHHRHKTGHSLIKDHVLYLDNTCELIDLVVPFKINPMELIRFNLKI